MQAARIEFTREQIDVLYHAVDRLYVTSLMGPGEMPRPLSATRSILQKVRRDWPEDAEAVESH